MKLMKIIIILLFLSVGLFGESYSCPGEDIANVNGADDNASKSYSTENKDVGKNGGRYFKFKTNIDGNITISQETLKDVYGYKNHKLKIGISCGGTDIYNGSGTTSDSKTFSVASGTTYYIKIQEGNIEHQLNVKVTFDFIAAKETALEIVEDANDICYDPMESSGWMCMDIGPCGGGIGCKKLYPIKNLNNQKLDDVKVIYDEDGLGGTFGSNCGVDPSGTCQSKSDIDMGPVGMLGQTTEFSITNGMDPASSSDIWVKNFMSGSCFNTDRLYATYIKNGKQYRGKIRPCPISYCEQNGLSEGFHVIDPDDGDEDNSFEIFCHKEGAIWHDLVALPIKNNSNNFVFNNADTSLNYYNESDNPRTHFHAIEIDGGHITYDGTKPILPVITARSDEPWDITTDGHAFKVMGSLFSNINLIGTPFTIDWDKTGELRDCNETVLRKALDQAVKYNTLVDDGHSRCEISTMNLSLLDDYRFLVYNDDEVLQHSCKEMAAYVPNNVGVLDDESVAGHFNILTSEPAYPNDIPTTNGQRTNSTDLGDAKSRPLTVYCKYQTDLHYVWTFLTALDGVVTNSKNDITNKADTCSQLGLWFFVPNTKETFNRVRLYLKSHKNGDNGWENYTGTVREKYKMYNNNPNKEYYLNNLGYEKIWPYGPLGVYYPCYGNHDANAGCSSRSWYPGHTNVKGWMSGSPMHNISTMSNYNDSMGKKGWVSILGEQDLNKTNEWWISDIGAGEEIGYETPSRYAYNPHGTHLYQSKNYKYYEPNGNYTQNAWLNFLHDDEGWIYHNDDNNAFYAYYDYTCMSETNYDYAGRYTLIPGFFNAIERATRSGNTAPEFSDTNITTKIVNKTISLDILLYKLASDGSIDRSQLNTNENKSVGVFLSTIEGNNVPVPIKFLGEFYDFDGNDGRIQIPDFTISTAQKRVVVQFYYCNASDQNWTDCWDYTNSNDAITISSKDGGDKVESLDDFAIRPKKFDISVVPLVKAGTGQNYSVTAMQEGGGASSGYTVSNSDYPLDINTTKYMPDNSINNSLHGTATIISYSFSDGSSSDLNISYDDVGKVTLHVEDQKWAEVDADDTPASCDSGTVNVGMYICGDTNTTFIPDHFSLSSVKVYNEDNGSFTYLSSDLNMSASVSVTITAQTEQNTTTQNFDSASWENPVSVSLHVTPPSGSSLVPKENNITNQTLGFATGSYQVKGNETNPSKALLFNFQRAVNNAINPFDYNGSDVNVSVNSLYTVSGSSETIVGDENATQTVRFLYGKAHAPKTIIKGDEGNATLYF